MGVGRYGVPRMSSCRKYHIRYPSVVSGNTQGILVSQPSRHTYDIKHALAHNILTQILHASNGGPLPKSDVRGNCSFLS